MQAAEAQVHLADLSSDLFLETADRCVELLREVMPLVLGNGSLEQQALLYWTLAVIPLKQCNRTELASQVER